MSDLQSPVELCMVKIGWDKIKHNFWWGTHLGD